MLTILVAEHIDALIDVLAHPPSPQLILREVLSKVLQIQSDYTAVNRSQATIAADSLNYAQKIAKEVLDRYGRGLCDDNRKIFELVNESIPPLLDFSNAFRPLLDLYKAAVDDLVQHGLKFLTLGGSEKIRIWAPVSRPRKGLLFVV